MSPSFGRVMDTQRIHQKTGKEETEGEEENQLTDQMTSKGLTIRELLPKVPFQNKFNQVKPENWKGAGKVTHIHLMLKYLSTWSIDNTIFTMAASWKEIGMISQKILLNKMTFKNLLKEINTFNLNRYLIHLEESET
ncbi:hypothetical protein O181_060930 [Austropuccinia psidii MF-1]|uniref:Uncharacterized protein n=1 Tax=Austropuccinia psidii MF-1 TaxID=1389203 RepID=A0A9Q3I014_9BASI|nr:hypothetical protein [Austropuccinia psidii MF-1]